ncbi:hypothetical protein F5Y10DRAFT_151605 [Nemania abortiva]|nr:hypothetical protein F5Y10DRAFT_151605 [Nemania abortiva]
MEGQWQVTRPQDARQYRQRSVSVLPRSDPTPGPAASRYVEYPDTSTTPRPPRELVLSSNTYERLEAAKREQDGLMEQVRAEVLELRERLRRIRQFRESAGRETREREENLRQQQRDDLEQMMWESDARRAIEEEKRTAEVVRREATRDSIRESMILMRDEAVRQRQVEQDRILAEQIEAEARIEEARIQAQEEAEERERIRRERLRECVVCMEQDDMGSMIQGPCAHWYCSEDLHSKFSHTRVLRRTNQCLKINS